MPLFAKLFGSVASALASFFALFLEFKTALKLAAYTTWITVFTAFLVSVFICVSSILSMLTSATGGGGAWVSMFFMGMGMFIPSNAAAVMSCLGSIWISTSIYSVQKQGIFGFGS